MKTIIHKEKNGRAYFLVDDDRDLCGLLSKYLRGKGLEVEIANDG